MMHVPNKYRMRIGPKGLDDAEMGNNGAFLIQTRPGQPPCCPPAPSCGAGANSA